MPLLPEALAPSAERPLVDRGTERHCLGKAMNEARAGRGQVLVLEGEGGVGKTRLAMWAEGEAELAGFEVRWGRCLREVADPFFPWFQMFPSASGPGPWASVAVSLREPEALPSLLFMDGSHGRMLRDQALAWKPDIPLLWVTRDRAATVQGASSLPAHARAVWLSREEGEGHRAPGDLDGLAREAHDHLGRRPGSLVVLESLEYLVTHSNFRAVLRLLQYLRDLAEESRGHIVVTFRRGTLHKREVALLETVGVLEGSEAPKATDRRSSGPPPLQMLALLDQLEAVSRSRPQLLLLDDLQWSDPSSTLAFQFLARNLRELPVLIVAMLRRGGWDAATASQGERVSEVLERLGQEGSLARLPLEGLDEASTLELVESLLPAPLGEGGEAREFRDLLRKSGGNPYLVVSTATMLAEQGWFRSTGGGTGVEVPGWEELRRLLPHGVLGLVRHRLSLLPPGDQDLLAMGAIQGEEFETDVVGAALGRKNSEIEPCLDRLCGPDRFLRRVGRSSSRVAFDHGMTREAVLATLPSTEQRKRALALARWWEVHRPDEVEVLSDLFHRAGTPEPGVLYSGLAAARAQERRVPETYAQYVQWGLELLSASGATNDELAHRLVAASRVLSRLGAAQLAARLIEPLLGLELAPALRQVLLVEFAQGRRSADLARARQAIEDAHRLESDYPQDIPEGARARRMRIEASILIEEGRHPEALAMDREALPLLRKQVDPERLGQACFSLAWRLLAEGNTEEAAPLVEEGLLAARRAGLPREVARLLTAESYLLDKRGELSRSLQVQQEAIEIFRREGDILLLTIALSNVAIGLLDLERRDAAVEVCQETLLLARRFGYPIGVVVGAQLLGLLRATSGRVPEGLALLAEAEGICRRKGFRGHLLQSLNNLAEVHLFRGDLEAAARSLEEARGLTEGAEPERVATFELLWGRLEIKRGHLGQASTALDRALSIARETRYWGEQVRILGARHELEASKGDELARSRTYLEMNELRLRLGIAPPGGAGLVGPSPTGPAKQ